MTYNILRLLFVTLFSLLIGCQNTKLKAQETMEHSAEYSEEYWKSKLNEEEYYVLREKGTERPHSGKYNDFYKDGSYYCAACNQKLFESVTKFDAHCGWPSFDQAIKGSVEYIEDKSFGMSRTEVVCSNCKSHLGHVFNDGPTDTTGMRYCMNSISLKFKDSE